MAALELTGAPVSVVVLGASNVSRGLPRLVAAVGCRAQARVDCFVAAGHGRSYGANSRVALRRLPSILACGLWRALDRHAVAELPQPPVALVTDIGNDLLYGFSVEQVAGWVRESVRRFAARGMRTAVTRLPLESLARVGPIRYRALRTLYVPGCRQSLAALSAAAQELDAAVVAIARDHGATLVDQPGAWYGLDAIHVRRRRLADLWQSVCDAWRLPPATRPAVAPLADWMLLGSRSAEVRSLARVPRFTPQPCVCRPNLRLWLY